MRLYIHVYGHVHIHIHIHIHICIYMYTYIHEYMHIYTYLGESHIPGRQVGVHNLELRHSRNTGVGLGGDTGGRSAGAERGVASGDGVYLERGVYFGRRSVGREYRRVPGRIPAGPHDKRLDPVARAADGVNRLSRGGELVMYFEFDPD